jgi:hypothetical protein
MAQRAAVGQAAWEAAVPDAWVVGETHGGPLLLSGGNFKIFSFADGSATYFGTKPLSGKVPNPFSLPGNGRFGIVGTIGPNGHEAGPGFCGRVPTPLGEVAIFANIRQSGLTVDSLQRQIQNTRDKPGSEFTVSINFGALYSVSDGALLAFTAASGGSGAALKLGADAAGLDAWLGLVWRASVTFKNGQIDHFNISGVKVRPDELGSFLAAPFNSQARNYGNPEIARTQRAVQLEQGASYFQLAARAGNYNHGDPAMAAINFLNSQLTAYGYLNNPTKFVRDPERRPWHQSYVPNHHAYLQNLNDSVEKLQRMRSDLLQRDPTQWKIFVDQFRPLAQAVGLNFGVPELSDISGDGLDAKGKQGRRYLVRDADKGRVDAVPSGLTPVDTRMLPALNPKVVDGHQVFLARPLLHNVGARVEGTDIARQGVLMKASTLRGTPVYWLQGSTENYILRRPDGSLVQGDAEAIRCARELIAKGKATHLRELDTKHLEPPLPSGQRNVDGVVLSNTQVVQRYVGARVAGTNQALQGAVMMGKGPEGTPVYWLQGKKDYVLRNPDGSPVSSPKQAVERARQLIANGAATSLHPLDLKVVNDPRPLSRSNVLFVDGVTIVGGKVRVGSVGGRDPDGKAGQGDLMWGRTGEGNVVFWLQGRQTNYLLRSPTTNDPIRSQPEAEERARELISHGAARDLRPLELAPQRAVSR